MTSAHASLSGVPSKLVEDLILETLLFARQTAREDLDVAKATFGITSSAAKVIASLTLPQIRTIAADNTRVLRVRWDTDAEYWGDLLVACRDRRAAASAIPWNAAAKTEMRDCVTARRRSS